MFGSSPAPAPYPSPVPAPMAHSNNYPSPSPCPVPRQYSFSEEEEEEEEEETETETEHHEPNTTAGVPVPAPMPMSMPIPVVVPSPSVVEPQQPVTVHNITNPTPVLHVHNETHQTNMGDIDENHAAPTPTPLPRPQEDHRYYELPEDNSEFDKEEEEDDEYDDIDPTPSTATDNKHHRQHLKAAADLIQTLDTEYARANAENATTALDAEQARSAARGAAEIVRRYTTRSHPSSSAAVGADDAGISFETTDRTTPTILTPSSFHPTLSENTNQHRGHSSATTTRTTSQNKYSNSLVDRLTRSHADDALALSLELERTKRALEMAQMAHDATKNLLAEERTKSNVLQKKLQALDGRLETERESLGRNGDALMEELERTMLRMQAAEEDAQLALDFAKESDEQRDQVEAELQEAWAEIQSLRETVHHYQYYSGNSNNAPALPPVEEDGDVTEGDDSILADNHDGSSSSSIHKRSVHFSDPLDDSQGDVRKPSAIYQEEEATTDSSPSLSSQAATTTSPDRKLISAGRKILQQSHDKKNATVSTDNSSSSSSSSSTKRFHYEFTPEKAAERRQQLRQRLQELDSSVTIRTPTSMSPLLKTKSPRELTTNDARTKRLEEICNNTAQLLQTSGKRLELDGHWFYKTPDSPASKRNNDDDDDDDDDNNEFPLESLARQYCQSVEVSTVVDC